MLQNISETNILAFELTTDNESYSFLLMQLFFTKLFNLNYEALIWYQRKECPL